jgi:shikimate dehydrogenase
VIGSLTCAYDLSYSQEKTPFLTWASSLGAAATADGLGMLIEQAALAFEIWFGQQPSTLALRRAEGLEARA